ncbi:MAG: AAA family ATPase, partial [Erysipelotrichaceae bacterium]
MSKRIYLTEDFRELIEGNYVYVDKTSFIKEVISKDVVQYTRPRRFGKTLNMSMLYYFFSNQEDSYNLFKDLNISRDAEAMKHLNKYPVIGLSLKEISSNSFDEQINLFKTEITYLLRKYKYLFVSDKLDEEQKNLLNRLYKGQETITELKSSLRFLSECLSMHFNENVVILIDEYDVPLKHAQQYGYYDNMLDFIRSLFSGALKGNIYLFKGIM